MSSPNRWTLVLIPLAAILLVASLRVSYEEDSAISVPRPPQVAVEAVEREPVRSDPIPAERSGASSEPVASGGGLVVPAHPPRLEGRVFDEDGAPLVAAQVRLQRVSSTAVDFLGTAETADDGSYSFSWPDGLSPLARGFEIQASAPLHQPGTARFHRDDQDPVNLRADLRLRSGGTVRGRIVNEFAEPVAGAHVRLLPLAMDGLAMKARYGAVRAGEDGRFAVARGASPGLRLDVSSMGVGRVQRDWTPPGPPGDVELGDILLLGPGSLEGRVVDLDGAPIPHLSLSASLFEGAADGELLEAPDCERAAGLARAQTWTDAEGACRFGGLRAGSYEVIARLSGRSPGLSERKSSSVPLFESGLSVGERAPLVADGTKHQLTGDFHRLVVRVSDERGEPLRAKVKCVPPELLEEYLDRWDTTDGLSVWSPWHTLDLLVAEDETMCIIAWVLDSAPDGVSQALVARASQAHLFVSGSRCQEIVLWPKPID